MKLAGAAGADAVEGAFAPAAVALSGAGCAGGACAKSGLESSARTANFTNFRKFKMTSQEARDPRQGWLVPFDSKNGF
jgi:hypothetical protein